MFIDVCISGNEYLLEKKLVNCGKNFYDSALWQHKFAGQIFAIPWQFAKTNSTALLSTNKVYKNTDQQQDIENWTQCEISNFRLIYYAIPHNHCLMYKRQYMKNWEMTPLPNERPRENVNDNLNLLWLHFSRLVLRVMRS